MSRARSGGFALVVVIILAAVVLVGTLGALHLGARRLDAERTERTRAQLPEAFRGLFPHAVGQPAGAGAPNLHTDFGYRPDTPTAVQRAGDLTPSWDLRMLVDRTQVGISDTTFLAPPPAFNGTQAPGTAWNGPYWRGAVDGSQRPLDAWGRFLELRYVTAPSAGWILHSPGANGVDNTPANSGIPGGDDLVYPSPPYVVPNPVTTTTYSVSLNLLFVLRESPSCGGGNNVWLSVALKYQDATGARTLQIFDNYQMHRRGNGGKPFFAMDLFRSLTLASSPSGSPGLLDIEVTGGCPDAVINPVDFQPSSSSLLTYLGSSTSGATTTYSFRIEYVAPPSTATPWPITIQP